jgi:hypothetical protein
VSDTGRGGAGRRRRCLTRRGDASRGAAVSDTAQGRGRGGVRHGARARAGHGAGEAVSGGGVRYGAGARAAQRRRCLTRGAAVRGRGGGV